MNSIIINLICKIIHFSILTRKKRVSEIERQERNDAEETQNGVLCVCEKIVTLFWEVDGEQVRNLLIYEFVRRILPCRSHCVTRKAIKLLIDKPKDTEKL
jgi:hypothetical protein